MLKRITLALLCSAAAWAQITPPALTQSTLTSNASVGNVALTLSYPFPFVPTGTLPGMLYVDSEAMTVVSASLNLQQVTVQRGARGTTPARHAAGALVFSAAPAQFILVDKSGACDPNSPQLLNVTDQKYFTCTAGAWVSASTVPPGGGATAPATTNLYGGDGSPNGIVAKTPGTDYYNSPSQIATGGAITGTAAASVIAGGANGIVKSTSSGASTGIATPGTDYVLPPSSSTEPQAAPGGSLSAYSYVQGATGSVGRTQTSKNRDIVSLADFPVDPTGVGDSTAAVQAWMNVITPQSANMGGYGYCPSGTYKITSSIVIQNIYGLVMLGPSSCNFVWAGNGTTPMFDLQDVAQSFFIGFRITGSSLNQLAEGIRISNGSGTAVAPTTNEFNNIFVYGGNGYINYGFRIMTGAGGDNNNDFMSFVNVHVNNYAIGGWSIESTQAHFVHFTNDWCLSGGTGSYCVGSGASSGAATSFTWDGGFSGQNSNADFLLTCNVSQQPYIIRNLSSEGSNRFINSPSTCGAQTALTIEDVRWSDGALNADGFAIRYANPGPVAIRDSKIGELMTNAVKIYWNYSPSFNPPSFKLENTNILGTLSTVAAIFPVQQPTNMQGVSAVTSSTTFVRLDLATIKSLSINDDGSYVHLNVSGGEFLDVSPQPLVTAAGVISSALADFSSSVVKATTVTSSGVVSAGAASIFNWTGRAAISSPADSSILLTNNAGTDFNRMMLGGVTGSFPEIKKSGTTINFELADESAYSPIHVGSITIETASTLALGGKSLCTHGANGTCGVITLTAGAATIATTKTAALAASGAAGDIIHLECANNPATTTTIACATQPFVSAITPGTSFAIGGTLTDTVYWEIRHIN